MQVDAEAFSPEERGLPRYGTGIDIALAWLPSPGR
jgi:hypothetical protein